MKNNVLDFIRPEIRKIKNYQPAPTLGEVSKSIGMPLKEIIKADSGENSMSLSKFYLYPDPECKKLRNKLAIYTNLKEENIVCGNGSDELIDLTARIFIGKGDEVIVCPPTFSMYEFYSRLAGAKIRSLKRDSRFQIDTKKILRIINSKTKLIFIDSPGNPTSVVLTKENLIPILKTGKIVVVDEAYFEYCDKTFTPLVKKFPNLIILRSFSKWAGLAGLRIGYMLADKILIEAINKIRSPYNVNSLAQETACTVLDNKKKIKEKLKCLLGFRAKMIKSLIKFRDLKVYNSDGAYVLCQTKNFQKIADYLKLKGILVKTINNKYLINCLRINLLTAKQNNKLIFDLRKFYEN